MDETELRLVKDALSGDDIAFEEVVRLFGRRLFAIAYGILLDGAEAEDVVQETFLKAYRNRWRLRSPEKFVSWINSIARHRACDVLRRRRHVALPENFNDLPDDDQTFPGERLERDERFRGLMRHVAKLPIRQRVALSLRYLEGMDATGIASAMGISQGALRGVLGRALATLRQTLSQTTLDEGRP